MRNIMTNFSYSLRNKTVQFVVALFFITEILSSPLEMQKMLQKLGTDSTLLENSWTLLLGAVWITCVYLLGKNEREKVESNEY